jgi:hypothetical protein
MTRASNLKNGSVGSVGSAEFLPAARDPYSRLPETYLLGPWKLKPVLCSRLRGRSGRRDGGVGSRVLRFFGFPDFVTGL